MNTWGPSMTPGACFRSALLVVVLASAATAIAANIGFLKDAPYSKFTEEDRKIFDDAVQDTLNKGVDGEASAWSNPATRAGGEIKVLKTLDSAGVSCRKASIANKAKGLSHKGEYKLCKDASGKWKLAE